MKMCAAALLGAIALAQCGTGALAAGAARNGDERPAIRCHPTTAARPVHPNSVRLTQEDVDRGWVSLEEVSRVESQRDNPVIYTISADAPYITTLAVRSDAEPAAGGQQTAGCAIAYSVRLIYRIGLDRSVKPGDYAWPIHAEFGAPQARLARKPSEREGERSRAGK